MPSVRSEEDASLSEERYRNASDRFILFWGEMASNWGINRTMAQIHALLFSSDVPLDTDAIMERLQISRGNANMNLRSLISWNLVRKVHLSGSRKDHYAAEQDVWEITSQIIRQRERQEIQPVMQQLQECRTTLLNGRASSADLPHAERGFCERVEHLMELMQVFEGFTAAALPLISKKNIPMIRQMLSLLAAMEASPSRQKE